MKYRKIFLLLLCFSVNFVAKVHADVEEKIDHLSLATLMIYDAKYEKAQQELAQVDRKDQQFDAANYYSVLGVLNSKLKKSKDAISAYQKAIAATKKKIFKAPKGINKEKFLFTIASKQQENQIPKFDPKKKKREKLEQLYMYLTQEYYQLKDYKNTLIALDNAGEMGKSRASLYTLRAECYYKQKLYSEAIEALNLGFQKFPEASHLQKQKFYYFADLKLYQAAIATAKSHMQKIGVSAQEYITLAQMLIASNENNSAIELLEESQLKFPKKPKITFLLAHLYLKQEMKFIAAHLFEKSAYYEKKYLKEAVEVTRQSGNHLHALYLNTQNNDKIEKLKQKIAIYLNAEEYRKIIGLIKALNRYKMLEDDNLRYAIAYAYYMSGDYQNAENQLKYISDSELFSKATVIRKNIEKCSNNSLECI